MVSKFDADPLLGIALVASSEQTPLHQGPLPEYRSLVQDYALCTIGDFPLGLGSQSAEVEASSSESFEQIPTSFHPRHRVFLVPICGYLESGFLQGSGAVSGFQRSRLPLKLP